MAAVVQYGCFRLCKNWRFAVIVSAWQKRASKVHKKLAQPALVVPGRGNSGAGVDLASSGFARLG